MFEMPALQGVQDRCNGLCGHHAATLVQVMWQHDMAVAQFIAECMDAHVDLALKNQILGQP